MFGMNANNFRPEMIKWLLVFILIDVVLRGLSLWRSAQRQEKWWFLALFLVNSLGVLPAIYLLTHKESKVTPKKKK
jgi:hypothetical protein